MVARSTRGTAPRAHAPAERREWTIASDVQSITSIVETVQGLCVTAGFSSRHCRLNIPVAITEALSNAILRGNAGAIERQVRVVVVLDAQQLLVEVTDEGDGFAMETMEHTPAEPDWLDREDGRGVFLMRALMDRVESQRGTAPHPGESGGHTLRLILHRT